MEELCSCLLGVENWRGQGGGQHSTQSEKKKHSRVLNMLQAQTVRRDTSLEDLCSSSERCAVPPLNVASLLSRPTSASRLNGHAHKAVSLGTCPIVQHARADSEGRESGVGAFAGLSAKISSKVNLIPSVVLAPAACARECGGNLARFPRRLRLESTEVSPAETRSC